MGSLYDIGNFRYKHFNFYACDSDTCSRNTGEIVYDDDGNIIEEESLAKKIHHDIQIKNFLNAVWPYEGIYGFGAEGDHAYVTYISQYINNEGKLNTKIENIYVYRRLLEEQTTTPIWQLALERPLKTLNLNS